MRVLLAGASGAIGTPLISRLTAAGHQVVGLTRSAANARRLHAAGVEPVVADAMDRAALLRALRGVTADAVVHELTALRRPPLRHSGMAATNALRTTGSAHLIEAAHQVGARRFITQSIVLGYGFRDHGERPLAEDDAFGEPVPGPMGEHVAAMRSAEKQAFEAPGLVAVALRYGLFYGPGAGTAEQVAMLRRRGFPVPTGGGGLATFVHIDDAAAATVAALERGGADRAYNIVDDEALRWGDYADTLARAYGVPRAVRFPGWLLRVFSPYLGSIMTRTSMRVDNDRARRELGWAPRLRTVRDGVAAMARG